MSERSHHHNPAAHSRSRPTREKGAVPFQLIGHHQLRTPRFHSPPCLGNGGSWIAGSRRLPLFPRKEGQARAELPHREPLTMHANRPLKDIACVLHAQTKDATVVCVIGCQITRTRIHTLPKRLASARHSRVRKLYSYQIHSARFKQTSQWRRKSWWCILPAALILWYAGSDVMGCRRPTGGVFSYVSSDRVTLRAFPVATPRGRSSSSHEGELDSLDNLSFYSSVCVCCKQNEMVTGERFKVSCIRNTILLVLYCNEVYLQWKFISLCPPSWQHFFLYCIMEVYRARHDMQENIFILWPQINNLFPQLTNISLLVILVKSWVSFTP